MNLIGARVKTIAHKNLHNDYFDLDGIITDFKEEEIYLRSEKSHYDPAPTGKFSQYYFIKFDKVTHKEMCNGLWLFRDMFDIV